MLLPPFNENFYLIEDKVYLFEFNNVYRTSIDCGFQFDFNFSLRQKKEFEQFLDKGKIPISLDTLILEFTPGSCECFSIFKPYQHKSNIKNKLSKDFKKYFYITQFLLFISKKVMYIEDIGYDYDLGIHAIKIGANGHAIFLFINFIEKFLKAYLIDQHDYTTSHLKSLSHDIKKIWDEVNKKIIKMESFNDSDFNNKISQLKSYYSANLRYENNKFSTTDSVTVNLLVLDIINYILVNTDHKIKEAGIEDLY